MLLMVNLLIFHHLGRNYQNALSNFLYTLKSEVILCRKTIIGEEIMIKSGNFNFVGNDDNVADKEMNGSVF